MENVFVLLGFDPFGTGVRFVEKARELNLHPILFSKYPSKSQLPAGLECVQLEDVTKDSVLGAINRIGRHQVRGVWSLSDRLAVVAAEAGTAIGREGTRPDPARICSDKLATRRQLASAGIEDVGFVLVRSSEQAAEAACALGGRVVIKPRFSAGSVGVRLCRDRNEAVASFNSLAVQIPNLHRCGALVETAVDGPQFSVQIFDGRSIGVTFQKVGPPPTFITVKLDFPWLDDARLHDAIVSLAQRAIAAVGHLRGPASVDIRCDCRGPHIIEINPRLAGDLISENVRLSLGIDLVEATVRFACGMPYNLDPTRSGGSASRWLLRPGSPIAGVLGCTEAASIAGVVNVKSFAKGFQREGSPTDSRDRVAVVITEAESPAKAGEIADLALSKLRVKPLETPKSRQTLIRRSMLLLGNRLVRSLKRFEVWTTIRRASLQLSIISDENSFAALAPEWEDLFQRAVKQIPFLRFVWLQHSWKRQRDQQTAKLFIVVIRKNGRPVLIAPLVAKPAIGSRQISFLDTLTPQYNDLLVEDSDDCSNYVELLWKVLESRPGIKKLDLKWVRDDSPLAMHLDRARQASSINYYKAPFIDLSKFAGWEDYLQSLPRKLRSDHGRQLRNLEKRGSLRVSVSDGNSYPNDLAWLFAQKRQWLERKGKTAKWLDAPGTEELFTIAAREGIESGRTLLTSLSIDGRTIASMLSFREHANLYMSKITYDPAWHVYSPARTLMLLTVKLACDQGIKRCDLMTGEGAWKDTISNGSVLVRNQAVSLKIIEPQENQS